MRTLISIFVFALLPAVCLASPADPTKSSFDPILVGNSSGADMGNAFHVVVRDVGNIPLAGNTVTIRFLTSPARPCAQQNSGTTGDCTNSLISKVTNGQGQATFFARVAGYDNNRTLEIRANGVLFGHVLVRSTDIDGDGTTGLRDLELFRERFVSGRTAPETDFNQDGVTNGYDFALLRAEFVRSVRNTVCP